MPWTGPCQSLEEMDRQRERAKELYEEQGLLPRQIAPRIGESVTRVQGWAGNYSWVRKTTLKPTGKIPPCPLDADGDYICQNCHVNPTHNLTCAPCSVWLIRQEHEKEKAKRRAGIKDAVEIRLAGSKMQRSRG